MPRYLNILFAGSALALLFPAYVSAASFFPTSDVDINLTGDTTFNFDSYTISPDINVSYFAPENSLIEIFSEGDIIINGALSLFGSATYSFTSNTGSFYLNGTLNILDNIALIINVGNDMSVGSGGGSGSGSGVTLNGGGGTFTPPSTLIGTSIITGGIFTQPEPIYTTGILTIGPAIFEPIIIEPIIFTPTPTTTGSIRSSVTMQISIQPVPIPPSLILFATGLFTLSLGIKRRSKKLSV